MLAALLGCLFTTQVAHADARTEARKHFKKGMELVAAKNFVEGIKELEKAYEILPHRNVLFNIAQAQAEGGSLDLAIRAYKNYLKEDPPDRDKVAQIVKQLEDKLAAQKAQEALDKAQPKPGEPKPGEPKPGEPGEPKPGEPKPGEPGEPKPGEPKPGELKPGEPKPGEPKPGEPKPGEQPAASSGPATKDIVGDARTEDVYAETVVTASRGAQSPLDAPNSTTIITRQDIELSGITRIPELLRRVAGMDVMQITGGDANVSMRGFNSRLSNKLLVLVNGRSVYNDVLGSTFWESLAIDVDQIERIEVVRGPGSALYGANAVSGVVNIITIAPGEGKSGFRAGFGDGPTGYGSAFVSGRKGDFAYRASGGYTRYPRWTREVSDDRVDLKRGGLMDPNVGAENARMDLRMSQRLAEKVELLFGGSFARSSLNFYGIGPFNDMEFISDAAEASIELRSPNFNAKVYGTHTDYQASASYNYTPQTLFPTRPYQNILYAELEYTGRFKFPKSVTHDLHAGVGYRLKDVKWDYLQDDVPTEHHGAVFLQDTLEIGKHVRFVASGRLDYVPFLQGIVGSPRGSLIIKPTEKQAVRVLASTAFRNPTFLESYLDLNIQVPLPGLEINSASNTKGLATERPRIGPENIFAAEIGYLNQESDVLSAEINIYYNRIDDLISLADTTTNTLSGTLTGGGGLVRESGRYNVGQGGLINQCDIYHVFGGEVGGRLYPVDGLDLFANYALNLSSQERPQGCNFPDDKRTSEHKVNAGVQVRTPIGINGEVTFHYQTGQLWREQVATLEGIVPLQMQLSDYALLNARLGYKFLKNRLEIAGTVFNALADVTAPAPGPQMHPFGNRIGRRFMGFVTFTP